MTGWRYEIASQDTWLEIFRLTKGVCNYIPLLKMVSRRVRTMGTIYAIYGVSDNGFHMVLATSVLWVVSVAGKLCVVGQLCVVSQLCACCGSGLLCLFLVKLIVRYAQRHEVPAVQCKLPWENRLRASLDAQQTASQTAFPSKFRPPGRPSPSDHSSRYRC